MNNIIICNSLSKKYKLYDKPTDRLKEALNPLGKRYSNDFYALQNVSFDIRKGETLGIIGKNGSGKSTLLKIITGVLKQTSGDLFVGSNKIASILELGAGFNLEYTGIENIFLHGTLMGYTKSEIQNKMDSILNFAEIGDFINQPVKTYSSGMFARLAFAVAVNVSPELLIVDEALAVGDIKFQTKCFNKFKEMKEKGVTILFVSHDVYSIRQFCDRAMWIHRGKLEMIGDTIEVTSKYLEFMNSGTERKDLATVAVEEIESLPISDFDHLNRWGSHTGLIQYANLVTADGNPTNVIHVGSLVKVRIIYKLPQDINLENFSCAFSIKSSAGLDLIVSTTFEEKDVIFLSEMKGHLIETTFEFYNYINNGDYILNVALEDRNEQSPVYYDYIEGAQYIKSINDRQQFGILNIPVKQSLYVKEVT